MTSLIGLIINAIFLIASAVMLSLVFIGIIGLGFVVLATL